MDAWPETQVYGSDGYSYGSQRDAQNEGSRRGRSRYSAADVDQVDKRSFMDRARGRPGLSIQTSNQPTLGPSVFSPESPEDEYNFASPNSGGMAPSRKDSVAIKSPLQKLEVALGDVSKEAKRARLEEIEQAAERRQSSTKKEDIPPLASRYATTTSRKSSQRDANPEKLTVDRSRSKRDAVYDTSSRPQAVPTGYGDPTENQLRDRTASGSIRFGRKNSQSRQTGYNAMLSGTAAAAAVNAYQFSRAYPPPSSNDDHPISTGAAYPGANISAGKPVSRSVSQPMPTTRSQPAASQSLPQHPKLPLPGQQDLERSNTIAGGPTSVQPEPPANKQSISRPEDQQITGDRDFHYQRLDELAVNHTSGGNSINTTKRQVVFDNGGPNVIPPPTQESHGRYHVSNLLGRRSGPARRYESSAPALDEWRNAGIATLTNSVPQQTTSDAQQDEDSLAWWERESPRDARKSQTQTPGRIPGAVEQPKAKPEEGRTFSPALFLKCGPLLRFTGIRTEHESNNTDETSRFWNGSVMIVTEDARSVYHHPPRLRLFKQSRRLQNPPGNHAVSQAGSDDTIDPLAGEMKVSRTGQPLYVRHKKELPHSKDLSRVETESGLFTDKPPLASDARAVSSQLDGEGVESQSQSQEVQGARLHAERGFTFWRFNLKVELSHEQTRIAYSINHGPAIGFWIPALNQSMNMMFHSCNGFSMSVNSHEFSGPDPLWRDVMTEHQWKPFHVMIGGGDQIYNDAAMTQTTLFQDWLSMKNPEKKHHAQFTTEMQDELESFYLNRYAMWFSQGMFGVANSQIPMVNIWDDHDIIDGFGSYPHHFMSSPVFTGVGAVAYKYYMLFQHQSVPEETTEYEPSWVLGKFNGPYIQQLSRSLFMSFGPDVAFLGLDCRTERMRDEIMSQETWDIVFDRCRREIKSGQTKHLIVLLGVPIAYPRLNFVENILTSRVMDPIKALGRAGLLGNFLNKFDGGVEILDDLDDHWTAKHHKEERNWFIQELQELAAEKSVRITILGGDVHLAAVGQFYSNKKLGIPKDVDHRYMPNIVSSAIVNTPPPEMMADILNKRNKVHHLDAQTDEHMIALFPHDVDGKPRNNNCLLPRRNWCSIANYYPGSTPPPTPPIKDYALPPSRSSSMSRSSSISRVSSIRGSLMRRLTKKRGNDNNPPSSFRAPHHEDQNSSYSIQSDLPPDTNNRLNESERRPNDARHSFDALPGANPPRSNSVQRSGSFRRQTSDQSVGTDERVNLEGGLDITIHCEINQKNPDGATMPYRMIVPALFPRKRQQFVEQPVKGGLKSFFGSLKRGRSQQRGAINVAADRDPHISQDHNPAEENSRPSTDARGLGLSGILKHKQADPDYEVADRHHSQFETGNETTGDEFEATNDSQPVGVDGDQTAAQMGSAHGDSRSSGRQAHDSHEHGEFRGPRAPHNIDQLPLSVQKRYSQFEPANNDDSARGGEDFANHPSFHAEASRSYASRAPHVTPQQPYPGWGVPAQGLPPPLGRVNNKYDLTPTEAEMREQEDLRRQSMEATQRAQQELEEAERKRHSMPIDITPMIAPATHRLSIRRGGRGSQRGSTSQKSTANSQEDVDTPRVSKYHTPPTSAKQASPPQSQAQFPSPLASAPVTKSDVAHARSASQSSVQQVAGNGGAQHPVSHVNDDHTHEGDHYEDSDVHDQQGHHQHAGDHDHDRDFHPSEDEASSLRSWSATPSPPPEAHDDGDHAYSYASSPSEHRTGRRTRTYAPEDSPEATPSRKR